MATWKRLLPTLCVALLLGLAVGADAAANPFTSKAVLDIYDEPIYGGGKSLSLSQVKERIIAAARDRDWSPDARGRGKIVATHHIRSHMAQVVITYDTKKYSIEYSDSQNLNYNGKTIHRNYNRWVANLRDTINRRLDNR